MATGQTNEVQDFLNDTVVEDVTEENTAEENEFGPENEEVTPFFLVEINTGTVEGVVQLQIVDGEEAQNLVNAVVKNGIFRQGTEDGVKVFPVVSAQIRGPFVVSPAPTEEDQ